MKKSIIITLLTLSVMFLNAQKKDTTKTTVSYDTVPIASDYLIRLDSATYVQFVNWVGSIPPNISKAAAYFYSAIDGSGKNVQKFPQYALKPKNKK
jgi:hypothetical protein